MNILYIVAIHPVLLNIRVVIKCFITNKSEGKFKRLYLCVLVTSSSFRSQMCGYFEFPAPITSSSQQILWHLFPCSCPTRRHSAFIGGSHTGRKWVINPIETFIVKSLIFTKLQNINYVEKFRGYPLPMWKWKGRWLA